MDFEQYNNIHNYLITQQYPNNFTSPQKQKLEKQSSNYIVKFTLMCNLLKIGRL